MILTSRDQLALAFTGYRSMRSMAQELGVSHQKLGRWLRGDTPVPSDPFTDRAVSIVFREHVKRTKWAAKVQAIPYIGPVFLHRLPLRNGTPGDRVVIHNAQYIGPELRAFAIAAAQGTQRFFGVSVRSLVDLMAYWQRADDAFRQSGRRLRNETEQANRENLRMEIRQGVSLRPMSTKLVNIGKFTNAQNAIRQIEQRLREKHEPASSAPGTVLAYEVLFQLYPMQGTDNAPQAQRSKPVSRRVRKPRRR